MNRRTFRYSEAFKLEVVEALESGKVDGIVQAQKRFGVAGFTTVRNWLRKYGKFHLMPKVVRVEKPDEKKRLDDLKKENARLKKALADSHMEALLYRTWFDVACEELGVEDVESFKKKLEKRL